MSCPTNGQLLTYIHSILQEHFPSDITAGKLQELKAYDQQHHTDYYITLYHYLLNERNQTKTAETLDIHRNTLVHHDYTLVPVIPYEEYMNYNLSIKIIKNRLEHCPAYVRKDIFELPSLERYSSLISVMFSIVYMVSAASGILASPLLPGR